VITEHTAEKVTSSHLQRAAYLYIRQSTLRQVHENTTSTERQYGLRQRALALGWATDQVVVIDEDLGRSGTSAEGRQGFQRLVADVGMGKAGIVIGTEVSRLARNNADWHRLLEICALSQTLILDEDGVYDPCAFNDRLLLGLKGAMSEAELHLLKARLRGGQLTKARRGELILPLPVGLVYDPAGRVVLDPDAGVRAAIGHLFATFERTGSARATVKAFATEGVKFPVRLRSGNEKGTLTWLPLEHHRVLNVLHNPRYAGAFAYGRRRERRLADGKTRHQLVPRDQWTALIPDAHPGYITWARYEANLARLAECAQARGEDRRASPPREGPALLQGMAVCGRCGRRMTVRYHTRHGRLIPEYLCQRDAIERSVELCARIDGAGVDAAVGELLLDSITPLALEVTLAVQTELEARADEADSLRRQHVERARHCAESARRRYLCVDPDNRLVAASLEADWNQALRALTAAQEDYERDRGAAVGLSDAERARIAALASDFPALWSDPRTPQRERKRMARLIIEDVTLAREDREITVGLRLRSGQTAKLRVPVGLSAADLRRTQPEIVAAVDELLDTHGDTEIATILNARGLQPVVSDTFTAFVVYRIRTAHGLASRFDRLRRQGLLTLEEMAETLGVHPTTVKHRAARGQLESVVYNHKNQRLYAPPEPVATVRCARCQQPIPERGRQGQRVKFCSVTCRTGAYAERRRAAGWVRQRRSR
jgi:DNA invertase Pin-like site-specific DNA recombinase